MRIAPSLAKLTSVQFFGLMLLSTSVAVAEDQDSIAEGTRVFSTIAGIGCKTCHGEYAEGDLGVGPFIRGATEATIRATIDATNEMVIIKNTNTEEEIKAIAAYIGYLGTMQVARTLAKRGRFLPAQFRTRPGTSVQLIIKNASVSPHTFKSDNMGIDDITISGRSTGSIVWKAPDDEREFSLYCTDCKLKDQFFTLNVDMSADEFKGAAPETKVAADDTM